MGRTISRHHGLCILSRRNRIRRDSQGSNSWRSTVARGKVWRRRVVLWIWQGTVVRSVGRGICPDGQDRPERPWLSLSERKKNDLGFLGRF